jgi:predicted nucleic acid-binding protein
MPPQPLLSLPAGEEILIDGNILIYAIGQRSPQCSEFMRRCAAGELSGFTTVEILNDVCHRLMLAEAAGAGLISRANAGSLQGKPDVVRQLTQYWLHLRTASSKLAVLPFDEFLFHRAQPLRVAHGLMANDSAILAAASVFGLNALASNDSDFDAVAWINVYKPTDIP